MNKHFSQLEEIIEIEKGKRLVAKRVLHGDESYLIDHFPLFPVMPGVLMLESLLQASTWLIRYSSDFETNIVQLKEARNIKFQDFVSPGMQLTVSAEIVKHEASFYTVKANGTVDGNVAVSGRLILDAYQFGEREEGRAYVDAKSKKDLKEFFDSIYVSN